MSFREITMQDGSQVLRRYQAGQSARHLAHVTGLDRKTVGRYLADAKDKGILPDTIVSEEVIRAVGKKTPAIRLDDPSPSLEAQIDFGLMGMVTESEGKKRQLYVLLVTLSRSRYMFVWPCKRNSA